MSSVKIVYALYNFYGALSDEELRHTIRVATTDSMRYLRGYLNDIVEYKFELTYKERQAIVVHRDVLRRITPARSTTSLRQVLFKYATCEMIQALIYPVIRKQLEEDRQWEEEGRHEKLYNEPSLEGAKNGEEPIYESDLVEGDHTGEYEHTSEDYRTESAEERSENMTQSDTEERSELMPRSKAELRFETMSLDESVEDGDDKMDVEEKASDEDSSSGNEDNVQTQANSDNNNGHIKPKLKRWRKMSQLNEIGGQEGGSSLYSCDRCPKKFKQHSRYKEHMNTHRKYQEMTHSCNVCGRKYASSWAARRHEKKCGG